MPQHSQWKKEIQEKRVKTANLVVRAKGGDKNAQTILAKAPYHMRVYSEDEIRHFSNTITTADS